MLKLLTLLPLLAYAAARDLQMVTNTNSTVYAESKHNAETIGYYFALTNNVLSVMINGTTTAQLIPQEPVGYMIMPQLLLEYNQTMDANKTESRAGFMFKQGDIAHWGTGLAATKFESRGADNSTVDVWQVSANWTNSYAPDGKNTTVPKFHALMYIASAPTKFEGHNLTDDAITIRFSILEYPFMLNNSTLALNQLALSESAGITAINGTSADGPSIYGGNLRVDKTALVDGEKQNITIIHYNNEAIDIVAGNSTRVNVTSWTKESLLLSFANSYNAKNVTFDQRLGISMSNCDCEQNANSENSANLMTSSTMLTVFVAVLGALVLALPVLVF
ncbi:hypothetical protein PSACC_01294 [Paramicrosporidium saccamoebae]|uniref:Uncharacterized protein n=1 Tax=Paramicrosporidium saccamoebae TaxID=1246581 RepID=A0A2H9TM80_9FUNG|nr:hypothetical protein PSACC_01294 [Paramicrosporidium saccamoebae]